MDVTIRLTDDLEADLRREAAAQRRPIEEVALGILSSAFRRAGNVATPEQVVTRVRAIPPTPGALRPARGSLADALRAANEDPAFDLAGWERDWAEVETEINATTRADDLSEGRG